MDYCGNHSAACVASALPDRVDQVSPEELQTLRETIRHVVPGVPLRESRFVATGLINAHGERVEWTSIPSQAPVVAFMGSGITARVFDGRWLVGRFRSTPLAGVSSRITTVTQADVEQLQQWCRERRATRSFCTQKDLVKLQVTHLGGDRGGPSNRGGDHRGTGSAGCGFTTDSRPD